MGAFVLEREKEVRPTGTHSKSVSLSTESLLSVSPADGGPASCLCDCSLKGTQDTDKDQSLSPIGTNRRVPKGHDGTCL